MTRTVFLFENGTARVNGIEADALGDAGDRPFLTEQARVRAVKSALSQNDLVTAERAASRQVISPSEDDQLVVRFVSPPEWERYGDALWNPDTGETHPVFHTSTMLVDGMAVPGCVGLPFQDEKARRDCATWCLRNKLEEIAKRVAKTPIGGDGPYCTWPTGNLAVELPEIASGPDPDLISARGNEDKSQKERANSAPTGEQLKTRTAKIYDLFGGLYEPPEL